MRWRRRSPLSSAKKVANVTLSVKAPDQLPDIVVLPTANEEHDRVDVDEAIRARRTLKAFTHETVDEAVVRELLDLAVLAPEPSRDRALALLGRRPGDDRGAQRGDGGPEAAPLADRDRDRRRPERGSGRRRGGLRRGRVCAREPHARRARSRARELLAHAGSDRSARVPRHRRHPRRRARRSASCTSAFRPSRSRRRPSAAPSRSRSGCRRVRP